MLALFATLSITPKALATAAVVGGSVIVTQNVSGTTSIQGEALVNDGQTITTTAGANSLPAIAAVLWKISTNDAAGFTVTDINVAPGGYQAGSYTLGGGALVKSPSKGLILSQGPIAPTETTDITTDPATPTSTTYTNAVAFPATLNLTALDGSANVTDFAIAATGSMNAAGTAQLEMDYGPAKKALTNVTLTPAGVYTATLTVTVTPN